MAVKKVGWRDWLPDWRSLGKIVFYLGSLYFLQVWVVVPLAAYVSDGGFFADETASAGAEVEQAARAHCGDYLQQKIGADKVEFPFGEGRVWEMGGGRYLVQASALVTDSNALARQVNYVCYVNYQGGDAFSLANWTLRGLDWRLAEQKQ
ncbi:hypothetical protein JCM13664_20390 [Methylothermus subterraneus]